MTPPPPPSRSDSLFDASAGQAPTLTVPELSAQIARLAAQAFPNDVWVSGQIRNLSRSGNGHVYFDLVEPTASGATPGSLIAVTLLAPERTLVNRQITRAGGAIRMEDGIEVRIRARLRWYEPRGTLQLRMNAIDPEFTLGRLKADRDRVLATLQAEGLLEANSRLPLPLVPLRVALLTSRGSAAHADVVAELSGSHLAFDVTLLDVRTQGTASADQVAGALGRVTATLANDPGAFDVVLLVRGGGATTDLAVFDAEPVARAIAAMGIPVVTGIGHEIDRSVADEVAHTCCKTPTAAAATLVGQVRHFLARLDRCWEATRRAALAATVDAERRLDRRSRRAATAVERVLRAEDARLQSAGVRVGRASHRTIDRATTRVEGMGAAALARSDRAVRGAHRHVAGLAAQTRAHDPATALRRGWTITTGPDGRVVRSVDHLAPGVELTTRFADGSTTSAVTAVHPATVPGASDV